MECKAVDASVEALVWSEINLAFSALVQQHKKAFQLGAVSIGVSTFYDAMVRTSSPSVGRTL